MTAQTLPGAVERDDGIARAVRRAPAEWIAAAHDAVDRLAATQTELSADDVWREVGQPPEPRALGGVMVSAGRRGVIEATDRTVPSVRPESHRRPIRIWRSLVVA